MTVIVQPDLMQKLWHQGHVHLLILSSDPPDRIKAALEAAIPQIQLTGELLVTGETVIAGQVLSKDGTTHSITDEELETGELDGPPFVDGPVPIPGGQLLTIDLANTAPHLCQEIPGILTRHLEEAGIQEAEIRLAPQLSDQRFEFLGSITPVARAWLRSRHPLISLDPGQTTSRLLDIATSWLRNQHQPEMELLGLVSTMPVPLTWDTLRPIMDNVLASDTTLAVTTMPVISSDFQTSAATIVPRDADYHGGNTGISLGAAGIGWTIEQIATRMRSQREVIRSVASELSWAGVTAHDATPGWLELLSSGATLQKIAVKGVKVVPAPMWYQVLSQGLVHRLGGPPPGSVDLGNGSIELTIGEPEQWVRGHPDHDAIRALGLALFLGRR